MYVPSSDGTLVGYSIDLTTGLLTTVPNSPYTVAGGTSIASDAAGALIFVGDVAGQQISVFVVNTTDGSLSEVTGSPFPTSAVAPAVMATDGKSKFLYASEGPGSSVVGAYSIGSGGILTAVAGNPFSFSMSAIAGEPSGKYLLGITGQEADNHIHVFGITSASGVIAEVAGSPFATTFSPIGMAVHPTGAWVYTFNEDVTVRQIQPMEGFEFSSATGVLAALSTSPFTDLTNNGGSIEPSGQFIFGLGTRVVGGRLESTVTPLGVDTSTGALSETLPSLGFPGIDAAAFASTDSQ